MASTGSQHEAAGLGERKRCTDIRDQGTDPAFVQHVLAQSFQTTLAGGDAEQATGIKAGLADARCGQVRVILTGPDHRPSGAGQHMSDEGC